MDKKISGITIWRILTYFIIYSVLGFIIETLFALINYKTLESRQSFLYGPFLAIYGIGAVVMIIFLNRYSDKGHKLFIGGCLVGGIIEYTLSLIGELILNIKWWDYSDKFLNINGRVCLLYCIFWGLLALYLVKCVNPKVDKFIDFIKEKVNINTLKAITLATIIFMIIDCIISAIAIHVFLLRVSVEKDLDVKNKEEQILQYEKIYNDEKKSQFIYKYWNDDKMLKEYPNLTIQLKDGTITYIKTYLPEIQPYYYKWE